MTDSTVPSAIPDLGASEPSFEDDWDAHWSDYAVAAQHNPAQNYRRALIMLALERHGPPRRLIDLGSGQGDFLLAASQRWPQTQLVGLEPSRAGNQIAEGKLPAARFLEVDVTADPKPMSDLLDWATHAVCSEVLEHLDDPVSLLRHARAYLAPGAKVVVTVPGGPMSAFDSHIGHRRHYTPESLQSTFAQAGLQTVTAVRAGFPFFNLYRRLVIARGERLARDVSRNTGPAWVMARAAMLAFRPLLLLSLPRSPWGTQIVGIASEPTTGLVERKTS